MRRCSTPVGHEIRWHMYVSRPVPRSVDQFSKSDRVSASSHNSIFVKLYGYVQSHLISSALLNNPIKFFTPLVLSTKLIPDWPVSKPTFSFSRLRFSTRGLSSTINWIRYTLQRRWDRWTIRNLATTGLVGIWLILSDAYDDEGLLLSSAFPVSYTLSVPVL